MKIALVTGSRAWSDEKAVREALDDEKPNLVMHGMCDTGADWYAHRWAIDKGVDLILMPALWNARNVSAEPRRNSLMERVVEALLCGWRNRHSGAHTLNEVVVIAAPLEGSRGTADMLRKCAAHQWRVRIVTQSPVPRRL
jgi:hypothetical protein